MTKTELEDALFKKDCEVRELQAKLASQRSYYNELRQLKALSNSVLLARMLEVVKLLAPFAIEGRTIKIEVSLGSFRADYQEMEVPKFRIRGLRKNTPYFQGTDEYFSSFDDLEDTALRVYRSLSSYAKDHIEEINRLNGRKIEES